MRLSHSVAAVVALLMTASAAYAEPSTPTAPAVPNAPPGGEAEPVRAKPAVVCRKEVVTGRRIAKATCRRGKDLERAQEASREWMKRGSQVNHVNVHKSIGDRDSM